MIDKLGRLVDTIFKEYQGLEVGCRSEDRARLGITLDGGTGKPLKKSKEKPMYGQEGPDNQSSTGTSPVLIAYLASPTTS